MVQGPLILRLAVAQWRIERPAGAAGWLHRLDREVADAVAGGADMVLLPEYAAMEAAAGETPDLAAELSRATAQASMLLEGARDIAQRHRIWLLPGTLAMDVDGRAINRAPIISPDGAVRFQDKHVMTRFEAERWGIAPGEPPSVFETPWGRIGVAVCFDAEFPGLVRAQMEAGAWLILVPACTDTQHGFHRVRLAATARAMEGQCIVALSPTVGDAPWSGALDTNCGHAAVFGPVDRGFPDDGVLAEGAPGTTTWLHVTLDPATVATARLECAVRNFASWPPSPPPCPVR